MTPKREIVYGLLVGYLAPGAFVTGAALAGPDSTAGKVLAVGGGLAGLAGFVMIIHGTYRLP